MLNGNPEMILTAITRPDGLSIRCFVESPPDTPEDAPLVIVVPPYARTMCETFVTSLYLTHNGFRVWRLDFTNHVGSSDGNIFDFTLSSAIGDLRTVIAALRCRYDKAPVGIVSSSLGSRAAFRAFKGRTDIGMIVSLVGVVNVRNTLYSILGRDLIGDILNGRTMAPSWEIFGYTSSTRFLSDVIEHDLYSLESTKKDVSACGFPLAQISAESDPWSRLDEVESVFLPNGSNAPRELYVLPGASHKLENNPSAARNALCQAIKVLKYYLAGQEIQAAEVKCPSFHEIVEKNRLERGLEKSGYRQAGTYASQPVLP